MDSAFGDPEALISQMMSPAVTGYLGDVFSGRKAAQAVPQDYYNPQQSFAQNAMNPQALQQALNVALGFSGGGMQITGYHGTPHTFAPEPNAPYGAFRNDAIGSGEGNQAFGYGHYVAGNPSVAAGYQRSLSQDSPGNLLEVRIKPDEHELLDWDRPLGQQDPRHILDKLDAAGLTPQYNPMQMTGESFYRELARSAPWHDDGKFQGLGYSPEQQASARLQEAGIPGIKYLDAGSRASTAPATYAGEMTPQQATGLQVLNDAGQASRWERDPHTMLQGLIDNYTNSSKALASGNKYILPGVDEKLAAMQSLDPALVVPPKRTSNYVIFHPDNLAITGKNGERYIPVEHDPFAPTPVEHDPFNSFPVEHDPFASGP